MWIKGECRDEYIAVDVGVGYKEMDAEPRSYPRKASRKKGDKGLFTN